MVKLFVVGFLRDMGEIELDQLFSNEGLVRKVTIIRDMQTGISKGYAFVEMMDKTGAQRAINALNGLKMGVRTVSVRIAETKASGTTRRNDSQTSYPAAISSREKENSVRFKRPRKPQSS